MDKDGIDGLLQQENGELRDRVADLEKKVLHQTDEIACLKSAMADTLRRLHTLETSRGKNLPHITPRLGATKTNRLASSTHQLSGGTAVDSGHPTEAGDVTKTAASTNNTAPSGRGGASATNNHHGASNANTLRRSQAGPTPSSRPTSTATPHQDGRRSVRDLPSATSTSNHSTAGTKPTKAIQRTRPGQGGAGNVKEAVFLKDESQLRIYLRGRAINMPVPSSVHQEYDVTAIQEAPEEKLKLEWVYGYRGRDCRNNVHYLPTGEIVYYVASVVVLFNSQEQTQRHYFGHNDDVKSIAIHPDKITIGTGQVAGRDRTHGKPHVRIWNSVNLNTLHILGLGDFERAVSSLAFSKADGGNQLCVIDDSNDHVISLWDWQTEHKVTETKSSTDPVIAVEFHPLDENCIVSCGKNHLAFWTLDKGQLSKKNATYEKYEKPKFVLSMTFAENGDLITGDSSGNIHIWKRGSNKISHCVTGAHDGSIFALCVTREGHLVSGGGKDKRILVWDSAFNRTGEESTLDDHYGPVRTIAQGPGGVLLVGTIRNYILQGNVSLGFSEIVAGGHTEELWCLACRPSGQLQFLTGSDDCHVVLWDALTHQAIMSKQISDPPHCAAFHPEGLLVAIGTKTARWVVMDISSKEIVAVHTDGNEQIECVQYSPDGSHLALGSRDNCIYVYSCQADGTKYTRVGKCCGHSSFVTHIDWSKDGQFLRSTSGDYELLYWNGSNCRQIPAAGSFADTEWASQTVVFGFQVAGIWPDGADGTDINACARSHKEHLLATADDFGFVKLFRYPTIQAKARSHSYTGHSSHVTNVSFLLDDSRLISTGGKDTSVMQWEVL